MEEKVFLTVVFVVFFVQILLTVLVEKTWPKWIPSILLGLLMVLCGIAYAVSGGTNWGFLILIAGLAMVLAGDGVAAVLGMLIRRLIRKK